MIETLEGLKNAAEIAKVPGVTANLADQIARVAHLAEEERHDRQAALLEFSPKLFHEDAVSGDERRVVLHAVGTPTPVRCRRREVDAHRRA